MSAKVLTLGSWGIAQRAMDNGQTWRPPTPGEVEATVKAVVSRGGRPLEFELALPAAMGAPTREKITVAMVQHLSQTKSIAKIVVSQCASLTPASATALCLLGPQLKHLMLRSGPHGEPPPQHSAEVLDTMARGVELLLRGLGPQLQELEADLEGRWRPQSLGDLSSCTALTRLDITSPLNDALGDAEAALSAESDIMRAVCYLTGLRHLELWVTTDPPTDLQQRTARAAPTISGLSALTALTSLELSACGLFHYGIHDCDNNLDVMAAELRRQGRASQATQLYAAAAVEWSALLAAVKDLPSLAELRTHARVPASDLAALTSLTYLSVGKLVLPPGDEVAGGARFELPPRLRVLVTFVPLPPRVAARLVPALMPRPDPQSKDTVPRVSQPRMVRLIAGGSLWRCERAPWCLSFDEESDLDEEGALRPEAAAAMRQAAPALLRCFDFPEPAEGSQSERGLCVCTNLIEGQPVKPAPALAAGAGERLDDSDDPPSHCASWLGSLAAVRPEYLCLEDLALSPRDMMGLAECMAGLKALSLYCSSYMVSSLPLLASMPHLAELYVRCGDWDWEDFPDTEVRVRCVEAAFLALTANRPPSTPPGQQGGVPQQAPAVVPTALPQLQLIKISYEPSDLDDAAARLERALALPRRQLQQRGGGAELWLVEVWGYS